jgi:uncharacterized protein
MKKLLFIAFLSAFAASLTAQIANTPVVVTTKKLKVVFQLTTADTLAHKALVRQCTNFLNAAPNAKIEVVCHSNGITFLENAVTKQGAKIRELKAQGIDFAACENTMRERKIKPEALVQECRIVPSGVVEVVLKQEKGWSYIKAGL